MDMLRHDDESIKVKSAFAAVSIDRFEEDSDVILDHEKAPSLPCREGYKVGSGRRDQSSRLQVQTSAAEGRYLCLG